MPQSLLTGQLKEKLTYRVWCLYSSFVHDTTCSLTGKVGRKASFLNFITGFITLSSLYFSPICEFPFEQFTFKVRLLIRIVYDVNIAFKTLLKVV
jgi:hypothetical protein